ncbi:MAG: hypothetical protein KC502_09245 [Myxococcales bacterium]|nr:hypothetical protein [Myxococcales bacterium]
MSSTSITSNPLRQAPKLAALSGLAHGLFGAGLVIVALSAGCAAEPQMDDSLLHKQPTDFGIVPIAEGAPVQPSEQATEPNFAGVEMSPAPESAPDTDVDVSEHRSEKPLPHMVLKQVSVPEDATEEEPPEEPKTPLPPSPTTPTAEEDNTHDTIPCKTAADCPVVANGCIVMGCNINDEGAGTCAEKAFVCQCLPGQDQSCSDNDPCTTDSCSNVGVCSHTKGAACDDGNECTEDTCAKSDVPGQTIDAVCSHQAKGVVACDDGDPCTGGGECADGSCASKYFYGCDDGDACTFDVCIAGKGCEHTPSGACE